jgi:exonuclease III
MDLIQTVHYFFYNLKNDLRSLGNHPIILAGDWNCTYSSDPLNSNIDCINMRNLRNFLHSQLIDDLCNELTLEDPYRSLNPAKVDFTYIPRAAGKNNRSRIDFFCVPVIFYANNLSVPLAIACSIVVLIIKASHFHFL